MHHKVKGRSATELRLSASGSERSVTQEDRAETIRMGYSDDEEYQQFLEWKRRASRVVPKMEEVETRLERRLDTSLNLPSFYGGTAAEAGRWLLKLIGVKDAAR